MNDAVTEALDNLANNPDYFKCERYKDCIMLKSRCIDNQRHQLVKCKDCAQGHQSLIDAGYWKICPVCGEKKPPLEEFWYRDQRTGNAFHNRCKECVKNNKTVKKEKRKMEKPKTGERKGWYPDQGTGNTREETVAVTAPTPEEPKKETTKPPTPEEPKRPYKKKFKAANRITVEAVESQDAELYHRSKPLILGMALIMLASEALNEPNVLNETKKEILADVRKELSVLDFG